MTPYNLTEEEEEKFSKKLEFYLRSTGRLFPITPAQVEAFEEYMATQPSPEPLPTFKLSAEEILQRGYMEYTPKPKPKPVITAYNDEMKLAARNKGELTGDILKMMREDQDKEKGKKK